MKTSLPPEAGRLLRSWRYLRFTLHLALGILASVFILPCVRPHTWQRYQQRWAMRLLGILGISLHVKGASVEAGCLLVANHVSWLDIFAIAALAPVSFIAKAEIRRWPLLGWITARNGTIFLMRGSRGHAKIINAEISTRLQAGRRIALFPEGTTTDGSHVLHFHAALLQPAIDAACPVQAIALRYRDAHGCYTQAPAYNRDISIAQSLAHVIAQRRLSLHVDIFPAMPATETHRRTLSAHARDSIVSLVCDLPRHAATDQGEPGRAS